MEESLLVPRELEEERKGLPVRTWDLFFQELKTLGHIAAPMVAVSLTQYLVQVFSLMMVGRLGELALSSTAIAMSLANVTGFSLMIGLASALETLCGQAYGAQQYRKLGTQTYTAMFCLVLVCIPLSLIWFYMGNILAIIVASLIVPISLFASVTLCIHVPLCWVLIFKLGLGNRGAAIAMGVSKWLNWIREFFQFAVPTAVTICLEWWSYEILVLLSGLLPNPRLEASVLSVCLTTIATIYWIAYGISAAASTRISNDLGAGNPQAARIAYYPAMFIALTDATITITALISTRRIFGVNVQQRKRSGRLCYNDDTSSLLL